MSNSFINQNNRQISGIYKGKVYHKRFSPVEHSFSYSIYMLALDLDELPDLLQKFRLFGSHWFNPVRFSAKDYSATDPQQLKQRIKQKVSSLGGQWDGTRVTMMAQLRCFGIYFSPINFYFCYQQSGECKYMLAEVSNTPWNERHYYLVNMEQGVNDKAFHVSPFMSLDMKYYWNITAPGKKALVTVENRNENKLFSASLNLSRQALTEKNLFVLLLRQPVMTLKIVFAIYWQALRLFIKRVPFVAHPLR